jgi:hypothetical protein
MGNRVTIEPTQFTNVRTGSESLGFRAYDDEDQIYCNGMDAIPDDDLEFLKLIATDFCDDAMGEMLDFVVDNEKGLYIGDTWYDFDDIKEILAEAMA